MATSNPTATSNPATMRAVTHDRYGTSDVLAFGHIARPSVADDDVLVHVRAAGLDRGAEHLMNGKPYAVRLALGLRRPRQPVPGRDVAGVVVAVGAAVTQFAVGDEVYGVAPGSFAEFALTKADKLARKPANLSFTQAAVVPVSAATALRAVQDVGRLEAGQSVLVLGASGGVGTFAVQIAKAFGAEVTAVCSTRNVDVVGSIGADRVIDYTKADFATEEQRYDLILAANGDRSIWDYRRALTADGCYAMTGGSNRQLTEALVLGPLLSTGRRSFSNVLMKPNQADLLVLKELCETGSVTPVIDRRFELHDVPAAIRYVEDGRARGKVVVTVK